MKGVKSNSKKKHYNKRNKRNKRTIKTQFGGECDGGQPAEDYIDPISLSNLLRHEDSNEIIRPYERISITPTGKKNETNFL